MMFDKSLMLYISIYVHCVSKDIHWWRLSSHHYYCFVWRTALEGVGSGVRALIELPIKVHWSQDRVRTLAHKYGSSWFPLIFSFLTTLFEFASSHRKTIHYWDVLSCATDCITCLPLIVFTKVSPRSTITCIWNKCQRLNSVMVPLCSF